MATASENEASIPEYIESARAASDDPKAGAAHAARWYHPEMVCEWTGRSPFAGVYRGREFFKEWAPKWRAYDVTVGELIDVLASDPVRMKITWIDSQPSDARTQRRPP